MAQLEFYDGIQWKSYYYTATIGAIFVLIIILLLTAHVLYHYIRIFHRSRDNGKDQTKQPYWVFFACGIIGIYVCLNWIFVRANIFTTESAENWTMIQCSISHGTCFLLLATSQLLMYFLFIYRIKISFAGTHYEYSSKVYRILYISIIVTLIIQIIIFFPSAIGGQHVLWYFDEEKTVLWCDLDGDESYTEQLGDSGQVRLIFILVNAVYVMVYRIVYDLILSYMFTKRYPFLYQYTLSWSCHSFHEFTTAH